ncbi:MAG: hypothetical protein A2Y18_00490 [Clostridiales bacterium GWD2_32_19]|nr:MAG: hypothetical protein A2Y18_00490 [Clostridiales bacterium GWD2_32_19]
MNIKKLEYLISMPEGIKLDFKELLKLDFDSDKKEFAKDISAIANSKGGRGYIIFGVKDKTKEIVGVELDCFNEEKLQQLVSNRIDPPVPIRVEIIEYNGKKIVVVTIFNSDQKPHQLIYNGSFYIRRGSTTGVAKRHEIANMFQEYGIVYFETTIMKHLTLEALDDDKIKKYIHCCGQEVNEDEKGLLQGLGIIKQDISSGIYHPTVGGMLLFGKAPQLFLPHTGVKIFNKGTIYYVQGTILEMINKSNEIINNIIKGKNYPIWAIKKGIANALVHRDYWDVTRMVEVNISEERIEIVNPGSMLKRDMPSGTNLVMRNPWLYEKLITLDDEKVLFTYGKGIEDIKKLFNFADDVKYINIYRYNMFKIILPGTGKDI